MKQTPSTLIPGTVTELAHGVRRLLAPNPGLMTGPGTNTYLLGHREIAVLDPGPMVAAHVDAIVEAAGSAIRWILVTHTHRDHSPAARKLAEVTGATLLGWRPPVGPNQDQTFSPDRELRDGEELQTAEFSVRAVHTPGHASNHLCYLHKDLHWLFTGDHVMNGSTVVINPPDGHMGQYLASLEKVKTLAAEKLAPGHGGLIDDPEPVLEWIIRHRLDREAQVVKALEQHGGSVQELVTRVYDDVDPHVHPVAERSLLAHLIRLRENGRADVGAETWHLTTNEQKIAL